MTTPKKNTAYELSISLVDAASPTSLKANPTLATGDFKISIDNGAFTNLASLPVVEPAGSILVKVSLSASEMNGDKVTIWAKDAAGAEWEETTIFLDVPLENEDGLAVRVDRNAALTESERAEHTWQGNLFYVDPINGASHASGARGGRNDPYDSVQDCHDNAVVDSNHDVIILISGSTVGPTTLTEAVTLTKRYLFIRGPGRDFLWTRTGAGDTIEVMADGIELSGFQLATATIGNGAGIDIIGVDFTKIRKVWINQTRGHGIEASDSSNIFIEDCTLDGTGTGGAGHGININPAGGVSNNCIIRNTHIVNVEGHGIWFQGGSVQKNIIENNRIHDCTGWGILIGTDVLNTFIHSNTLGNNASGSISDNGTDTIKLNNEQWDTDALALARIPEIVDQNWDEVLTGASHNVPTSAGRRLRDVSSQVITTGTTVTASLNSITLNGDAASTDGAYDPAIISIVGGTGFGQSRGILEYVGSTKIAIVDRNWKTIPDDTSEYIITAWEGREHVNEGMARGGDTNTITLNTLASSIEGVYVGQLIFIRSGLGDDQIGHVVAYDGTTKIATVDHNWGTIPDSTSAYVMIPYHSVLPETNATFVWSHVLEGSVTAEEFMRILLGVLSGITTVEYLSGGITRVSFKSIDGLKDRVIVDHDDAGIRSVSTLDGS